MNSITEISRRDGRGPVVRRLLIKCAVLLSTDPCRDTNTHTQSSRAGTIALNCTHLRRHLDAFTNDNVWHKIHCNAIICPQTESLLTCRSHKHKQAAVGILTQTWQECAVLLTWIHFRESSSAREKPKSVESSRAAMSLETGVCGWRSPEESSSTGHFLRTRGVGKKRQMRFTEWEEKETVR